jgi:hypothetical protein
MADLTIITNHVPRLVTDAYELTAAERDEFDYLDWQAIDRGEDSASFVRYKGELIDLGDFDGTTYTFPADHPFKSWDGYRSDSFFSGILVRYCEDHDHVIVARYYG